MGQHESDELVEGFMTIVIPDRAEKKNTLVNASGVNITKNVKIQLGICVVCAVIYRIKETDEDSNSDM